MAPYNKIETEIKRVLIATDKFKDGLSSLEAARAIRRGLKKEAGNISTLFDLVEMADGGDGSATLYQKITKGRRIDCKVVGPLGEPVSSFYILKNGVAFIEIARICSLAMVPDGRRNPLYTTTYGVGQAILHALGQGAKEIIIGVGGSATNDGGTGMLQALGVDFYHDAGIFDDGYMCGDKLLHINNVVARKKYTGVKFTAVCDVFNPLTGEEGATYSFGAQKGANAEDLLLLERGMLNFVNTLRAKEEVGEYEFALRAARRVIASAGAKGAGAAGGLGFALIHFLNAKFVSGFDFFSALQDLRQRILSADLVVSGEGQIDKESLIGKVVGGMLKYAGKQKPLWLFCGKNNLTSAAQKKLPANVKILQMADIEPDIDKRMQNEARLLTHLATNHLRQISIF